MKTRPRKKIATPKKRPVQKKPVRILAQWLDYLGGAYESPRLDDTRRDFMHAIH